MASSSQLHFEKLPTENVAEFTVCLHVDEKYVTASTSIVRETPLGDFMTTEDVPKGTAITEGFTSYLLTGSLPKQGNALRFLFAKPKTGPEKDTPFNTYYDQAPYPWPTWLRDLYAISDPNVPFEFYNNGIPTSTARVFERYEVIDGGEYETRIMIEEFQSPTPWENLYSITPQPTLVSWNYMGANDSIRALHGRITIPELQSGSIVYGFGTEDSQRRNRTQDVFPATNLPGWAPHVFWDRQSYSNGVWYRLRKTAIAIYVPQPRES